jgi:hypothetical protein
VIAHEKVLLELRVNLGECVAAKRLTLGVILLSVDKGLRVVTRFPMTFD